MEQCDLYQLPTSTEEKLEIAGDCTPTFTDRDNILIPSTEDLDREVKLAEEGTLMAKFQKDRTDAISRMFDRDRMCGKIHTTTQFFVDLDKSVGEIIKSLLQELDEECEKMKREELFVGETQYRYEKGNIAFVYNSALDDIQSKLKEISNNLK